MEIDTPASMPHTGDNCNIMTKDQNTKVQYMRKQKSGTGTIKEKTMTMPLFNSNTRDMHRKQAFTGYALTKCLNNVGDWNTSHLEELDISSNSGNSPLPNGLPRSCHKWDSQGKERNLLRPHGCIQHKLCRPSGTSWILEILLIAIAHKSV